MSLDPRDLRVGAAYESSRADARSDAIGLRRRRRVDLGDLMSVVFESRETLAAAAEEALRSERIDDPEKVAEEAGRFGLLLPPAGGLVATLFLEVSDAAELASVLTELEGVAESVQLEIDGSHAPATVFPFSPAAGGAPPVAYLRFELTASQREAWIEGARVLLRVAHPGYSASTELSDEQRAAIASDLLPAAAGERA
ncbi:MAG: DUF3501 family protein [Candidatus Dormibacteria bacterium]